MKLALLAVGALTSWMLLVKPSRALEKGRAYRATFQIEGVIVSPEEASEFGKRVASIMPDGAGIVVGENGRVSVTFVSPRSSTIDDVRLPVGKLKLVRLEAL